MSHVERIQIKGFYFEGFSSYPFNLYKNGMGEGGRLVVYNYDNQEEHSIELSHDQVLAFLRNVVNMPRHLELDAEYDGTWLSGTLEEATRKYNAMIEANNAAVRNAAGPLPPPPPPPPPAVDAVAAGPAVDADGAAEGAAEGGKRRHRKKRKSQKKRSGKRRKSHKRGHKKSRRH